VTVEAGGSDHGASISGTGVAVVARGEAGTQPYWSSRCTGRGVEAAGEGSACR
jgi:hypothetical protein